jgi:hypothetical protein
VVASTSVLTLGSEQWLEEHMAVIRRDIVDQAEMLANEEGSGGSHPIEPRFVAEAAKAYAPGTRLPHPEAHPALRRLVSGVTGITVMSALLAVIFGALALFKVDAQNTTGFLDIAKLLAGAVVGSTGASVVAGRS